ncbi:Ig domain-containing protein [Ideonella paludis]|uniref:Ig domain-containing protein n=1 Tax=Ideonella paludis TaxID=1233411 RepID=UPI00363B3854
MGLFIGSPKSTAIALAWMALVGAAVLAPQPGRASDGPPQVSPADAPAAVIRLPSAVVGQRYAQALIRGGQPPYSVVLESGRLDDVGLTLDATGLLSGHPTQPGRFVFTLSAQDARAGEPVRQRYVLHVLSARKPR